MKGPLSLAPIVLFDLKNCKKYRTSHMMHIDFVFFAPFRFVVYFREHENDLENQSIVCRVSR